MSDIVSGLEGVVCLAGADPGFRKRGDTLPDVYCAVTVMKGDVTIDFSVEVLRKNVHPVATSA